MAQTSSNKIVSLHVDRCGHSCPNRSVCYHMKKNLSVTDFNLNITDRLRILTRGWTIHESVCIGVSNLHWHLLKFYKNYNITISKDLYEPYLDNRSEQVQITVYTLADIIAYTEYQKLFLIKNDSDWNFFLEHFYNDKVKRTHFLVDQEYIDKAKVKVMCNMALDNKTTNTVDSCLMSYLLNGRCPFSYYNYVDITFDGSARSCPYARCGVELPPNYLDNSDTFKVDTPPEKCIYRELFGGTTDD